MTPDKTPSEAELLPCPFCGEAAKHSFNSLYGDMSMASCKSCGATAYAPKWNRRAVLAKWGTPPAVGVEPVARLEIESLKAQLHAAKQINAALESAVTHTLRASNGQAPAAQQAGEVRRAELVPGVMHCAKCKFQLNRVTLCVSDGNAYAGNNKTEPCPNGCGPLWPVTWEQEAKNCWKALEEMHERLMAAAAPQPTPAAQAASSAVLKAIRKANMQLVRTGDNAFMLVPYKVATAQAAESVPAGPRRKDMLWSTVKMQERHDQRIENIVSGLERIKQEHAGQQPQKIDECYGDCPTDSTTCTNPCRFDGRASRAPAESVWRDAEQKGGA